MCQPLVVGELVNYFNSNGTVTSSGDPVVSDTVAYVLGGVLAATNIMLSLPNCWYFYINQVAAMQMRTACSNLIYMKVSLFKDDFSFLTLANNPL